MNFIKNVNKKIIPLFLAAITLITCAVGVRASSSIESEVDGTYKQALALAGKTSFHGNCNLATAYQLLAMGIYKDGLDFSGAGNLWYDHFAGVSETSGGCGVVTVSGKNCLYDLIDKYGDKIYNVVYSLGTGGSSGSKHVLFIRAIIGGSVYFADSFGCTYGGKYYPEGKCTVLSVDKFVSSYRSMNGDPIGCVYFTDGKSAHISGSDGESASYSPGEYTVTASSLRIRAQASASGSSLGLIPNGKTVTVTKTDGNWGKITYNGISGWICLDYAEAVSDETEAGLRITGVTPDKTTAFSGDTVTWTAETEGGGDSGITYSFTVFKDGEEEHTLVSRESGSVSVVVDGESVYQVRAAVSNSLGEKAETYSDELVCCGDFDSIVPGDADCDGQITSADARLALRAAANLQILTGRSLFCADTDGNGIVASADARRILRKAAKLD